MNVRHKKKEETESICLYDVNVNMKVLNSSEEESTKLLNYIDFYLVKLLSQRMKIDQQPLCYNDESYPLETPQGGIKGE
ncbi:AP-3 complex subunit delta, putative [Plasmodium ovale wallikeri]|nr:AP-3 complex subunit delta, putative [Plasmodium ovale wallikeri]